LDTAIRPARDLTGLLKYAPPRARERPQSLLVKDEPPLERLLSLGAETAGPMLRKDFAANLRRRVSLDPELVPEPKSLKEDWTGAIALLRLTGVTVIAALIAWIVVSLPPMRQRSGNNDVHTALLPDTPNSLARHAADAIQSTSTLSSRVSQLDRTTSLRDDEEISTLIKLGQDFLKNGDFSSARLLLKRAAEAGSAGAALSLGETFDPLLIQRLGAIGVQPDAIRAHEWYKRSAELGSDAALQRLAKLAQAPQ
jgi:hypothetical protein